MVVYRYYLNHKEDYAVQKARKLFLDAYFYVSDFHHYNQNGKETIRGTKTHTLTSCLEHCDVFYVFNLVD